MRLLDLFCGAGGAAMGYHRAGFDEIIGVDIVPQPHYPFTFVQGDALRPSFDLADFDLIHASPPCQAYSRLRHLPWLRDRIYPDLIEPVRAFLQRGATPWIIENVEDAPLLRHPGLFGVHGVMLCGQMFGLPVYRHRLFESDWIIAKHSTHPRHVKQGRGRFLNQRRSQRTEILTIAGHSTGWSADEQRAAMGIPWMILDELTQAIPPAYTQFIGEQFIAQMASVR